MLLNQKFCDSLMDAFLDKLQITHTDATLSRDIIDEVWWYKILFNGTCILIKMRGEEKRDVVQYEHNKKLDLIPIYIPTHKDTFTIKFYDHHRQYGVVKCVHTPYVDPDSHAGVRTPEISKDDVVIENTFQELMYEMLTTLHEEYQRSTQMETTMAETVLHHKRNVDEMNHPDPHGLHLKGDEDYEIKMDGNERMFADGFVRYTKEGKGRYDLIPMYPLQCVLQSLDQLKIEQEYILSRLLLKSLASQDYASAIAVIADIRYHGDNVIVQMLKDLAVHFEKGAVKYGENNWRKGKNELWSFIDSGMRHTMQFLNHETDEPHHISAIWNFFCYLELEHEQKTANESGENN